MAKKLYAENSFANFYYKTLYHNHLWILNTTNATLNWILIKRRQFLYITISIIDCDNKIILWHNFFFYFWFPNKVSLWILCLWILSLFKSYNLDIWSHTVLCDNILQWACEKEVENIVLWRTLLTGHRN